MQDQDLFTAVKPAIVGGEDVSDQYKRPGQLEAEFMAAIEPFLGQAMDVRLLHLQSHLYTSRGERGRGGIRVQPAKLREALRFGADKMLVSVQLNTNGHPGPTVLLPGNEVHNAIRVRITDAPGIMLFLSLDRDLRPLRQFPQQLHKSKKLGWLADYPQVLEVAG